MQEDKKFPLHLTAMHHLFPRLGKTIPNIYLLLKVPNAREYCGLEMDRESIPWPLGKLFFTRSSGGRCLHIPRS